MTNVNVLKNNNNTANNQRPSFKDYFFGGTFHPPLEEGKHQVSISCITWNDPKEKALANNPNATGYVRIDLTTDNDRPITLTRFEQGFHIFLSQIAQQLQLDESIPVPELMQKILQVEKLDMYVSYVTLDDGRTFRNENFLPPKPEQDNKDKDKPVSNEDF